MGRRNKKLIANAPVMAPIIDELKRIATSWRNDGELSVLLLGPSGAGKGEVARELARLHDKNAKVVRVDCSARGDLLRDDLLGHARGAFTGAAGPRAGALASAGTGVLFLDEVGDLSDESQRLLRDILGNEGYTPIGADRSVKVECHIVAATNKDLWAESQAGRFREDLFWRVARRVLTIPALRERREDIPAIADELASRCGVDVTIAPECAPALMAHDWPGNVRELETIIECAAAVVGRGGVITAAVLAGELARRQRIIEQGLSLVEVNSAIEQADVTPGSAVDVRRQRIVEMLETASNDLGVADLAQHFNVAARTIQRDLAALEDLRRIDSAGSGRATRYRVATQSRHLRDMS